MTNTIPNVPRELLDSLLTVIESNGYAADEVEVVDELRSLLSAPSPAGVDGWDVAGDILEKLSAAQAIIDGLRGEVDKQELAVCRAVDASNDWEAKYCAERRSKDQQAQRIGALEGLLRHAQKQVPTGSGLHMRIDAALSAVCAAAPNIATTSEHNADLRT